MRSRVVVIDKLPFASPEDPLLKARLEGIRRRGGNPFRDFQLPQAVLALKQGVGRLIRDREDFGVVAICDPRLHEPRLWSDVPRCVCRRARIVTDVDEAVKFPAPPDAAGGAGAGRSAGSMRLLALDAATEACSAALLLDDVVSERYEVIGRGHAERLLPMADALLARRGRRNCASSMRSHSDAGRAVSPGFESPRGLRRASRQARDCRSCRSAISPLSPRRSARVTGGSRILACLDARMGEVYWAAFERHDGMLVAATEERLSKPDDVLPRRDCGKARATASAPIRRLPRASELACRNRRDAVTARGGHCSARRHRVGGGPERRSGRALPVYLRNDVVHRR